MPARLSATLMACASVLALAACKDKTPPAPAGYDFASAPPAAVDVSAPVTAPARYRGYAPAERAYAFDRAVYRAPPSYGFRYGEEEPWAWRTEDDYSMYVEPYEDGYRSYYYAPGGDYPYFVRDDDYGYAYSPAGLLIAIYDAAGLLLPQERLYALAPQAGTYLVRASAVRRYALDDSYRVYVSDSYWSERAPRYYQTRETWYAAPERQPEWRAWRASHEGEVARDLPRGDVRRWKASDERAWKAYEQADRKAWKTEDETWRKAERREGRQVAVAAPPPAPIPRAAMLVERQDRDGRQIRDERQDRQGRRIEQREEPQRTVTMPPPEARGRDRAQVATVEPRRGPERAQQRLEDRQARQPDRERPEPIQVAPRERGRGHEPGPPPQVAKAEPPRELPREIQPPRERGRGREPGPAPQVAKVEPPREPPREIQPPRERGRGREPGPPPQVAKVEPPREAPPAREHGGGPRAEPRQEVAVAASRPAPERAHSGGPPEPSPQAAQHGKGGGKPDRGKDKDKDKDEQ
jgi:hypothetical protein